MDQAVICRNIVSGRLTFPKNFNPDSRDLIERLLMREIQNRLGEKMSVESQGGILNSWRLVKVE